ncbi:MULTISPECIES: YggT family protein [Thermoactinomyces]|jgi:YggT family protein|uniref:YggT family protein n=1 Tax=Thermoactinomyces daqus TaxID=1329516 RepID=A0A7W1X9K5_9BACL|nr:MULTISPECIES: YggT family protein [Thermoactinomyces]MBA4542525.1 YggT family protein [Thermoactinomyces daqus]MBH8598075.1 YggT family protein [Thermoactinomyces sp. CICC 10523]MBH8603106.1 YggT family protein [Thermoactinomyces sp. CICC 10522]MBH8607087.1 YggT family protein [Thermoactinomyces sp. CICC 10521]
MILSILNWAFEIYYILIIIYVFLSWVPNLQGSPVGILLQRIVEPYLSVFRRFIPPIGMIDISPIVALFALHFVQMGIYAILGWVGLI